mmetsp:Transcript_153769/g.279344  ORF Transcript_153769/g.279344 Transcript_153769/m.279344 type:complete len:200 (+) Transcript_153769:303-902(+)
MSVTASFSSRLISCLTFCSSCLAFCSSSFAFSFALSNSSLTACFTSSGMPFKRPMIDFSRLVMVWSNLVVNFSTDVEMTTFARVCTRFSALRAYIPTIARDGSTMPAMVRTPTTGAIIPAKTFFHKPRRTRGVHVTPIKTTPTPVSFRQPSICEPNSSPLSNFSSKPLASSSTASTSDIGRDMDTPSARDDGRSDCIGG